MKYISYWLAVAFFAAVAVLSASAQTGGPQIRPAKIDVAHAGPPQTGLAEDSVKAAVNLLFTGMIQTDAAMIRRSFADSAILQSISEKDGKTVVRTESIEEFAQAIARLDKGVADERIRFDVIRIDGSLAIVWAPYSFYYKGQLNHCGADSFQLVRAGGVWKIQYLIDTRRKQPCQ